VLRRSEGAKSRSDKLSARARLQMDFVQTSRHAAAMGEYESSGEGKRYSDSPAKALRWMRTSMACVER